MARHKIKPGEPFVFDEKGRKLISEKIKQACQRHEILLVKYVVLQDHVHMVVDSQNEKSLNEAVRKIKGFSSHAYQKAMGWEHGHQIWARKFNRKPIEDENALYAILKYIEDNPVKHSVQWDIDVGF